MSKVIKVTPVTVIKPPIEEEKPQEIIEVTPSLITSPDLPPTIDVESDIVNPIILSPIDMIQKLIDSQLEVISYEQFLSIIREVLVRFDTDPKRYKKEDYLKLILAIIACFKHLYESDYENDFYNRSVTEWSEQLSDEKVPTEKLVKETIDAIDSRLTWISNNKENQKQIDFINVVGDLDYYNKCKESYPNAQIFYQDEKKWAIYANGLEYDFNSLPGGFLPLSGGTMTGGISNLVVNGANNIAFKIKTGEDIYQNIKHPEISSSLDIILPSASGTLALTSDITQADITFQPTHVTIQKSWMGPQALSSSGINTACWLLSNRLSSKGSYLIQIEHSVDFDGGLYTGVFSYTSEGSGTNDEILLHRSGNNQNSAQCLFARIKYISNGVYLQICGTKEEEDCTELTIKIKKLL